MRVATWFGVLMVSGGVVFGACDSKKTADPAAEAAADSPLKPEHKVAEAIPAEAPAEAAPVTKPAEAAPAAKPAEAAPAAKPAEPVADAPAAAPTDAPAADPAAVAEVAAPAEADKPEEIALYPAKGTIVREADPESPAGVIQRVIAASLEPDEAKGWAQFEALLHSKDKIPNSLKSRRSLNYPASRRKAAFFVVPPEEGKTADPAKPAYTWAYAEEVSETVLKVFVNNPKSMPTPCVIARDPEADNKWRVTICSL